MFGSYFLKLSLKTIFENIEKKMCFIKTLLFSLNLMFFVFIFFTFFRRKKNLKNAKIDPTNMFGSVFENSFLKYKKH